MKVLHHNGQSIKNYRIFNSIFIKIIIVSYGFGQRDNNCCSRQSNECFLLQFFSRQLTSTLNLRDMFPDYPRMPDQIAINLRAIDQYVHVTSSTNTQPSDKQYFFRISLNDKTILIYTR
ncbi:unnamed protein product [Rotaria socialis]|uniref:Uncharacterized protein n=1 Tax=Rotaria socialis TaxID=392032 RepID=A0A818ETZ7_9BILA|nr:unnamed protein product [Rotaria socialis]